MANPTLGASIPQSSFVKAALWVSPDVVGGSGAWDAKNSVRYAPWGTLTSTQLGSTSQYGLACSGATNSGIDLGLANLHTSTPFDVSGSELTIIVCGSADNTGVLKFIQNCNGYSPYDGWFLGANSTYLQGSIAPLTSPSSSSNSSPTGEVAVYALTYDGTNAKVWKNGTQVGTIASTGNLSYNSSGERRAALFNLAQAHGSNAVAQKIFGAIVYNKALTQAELQTFGTTNSAILAGAFHTTAFDFGGSGTSATASGATLTGTSSISGGSASGQVNATALGATLGGTSSLTAGSASGGAATGTFTFDAVENNSHSGPLNSVAVNWTWLGGTIGAISSITNGTGTVTSSGMTISGLPAGVGVGIIKDQAGTAIAVQEGTVT